jgi:predicted NBD/HSP70 family sugar kinase
VVAGIEAAPLGVTVLLADLRGRVIARTSLPTGRELPAGQRLAVVIEAVRQALVLAGLPLNRLKAACVGVSGVIGHDGKISRSYFVPEWNNADISSRLSVELGCTVFLENDIKLAAYAEHHHGASQLASSSVYFQIDRHIAFATTLNGKIHQGAHKSAGELASLRGMRWTTNTVQGEVVWNSARSLDELVTLASGGSEAAQLEFRTFTTEIATRVVTVSLIVDPDLIVIGGGFAANETFMNNLRSEIDRLTLLDAKPGVLASTLHGEGTLIGALALSFQECSADLYGTPGLPVPELTIPESRLVSVAS